MLWTMKIFITIIKPKFHYTDFHQNLPVGKVADTNHASREHKPS